MHVKNGSYYKASELIPCMFGVFKKKNREEGAADLSIYPRS